MKWKARFIRNTGTAFIIKTAPAYRRPVRTAMFPENGAPRLCVKFRPQSKSITGCGVPSIHLKSLKPSDACWQRKYGKPCRALTLANAVIVTALMIWNLHNRVCLRRKNIVSHRKKAKPVSTVIRASLITFHRKRNPQRRKQKNSTLIMPKRSTKPAPPVTANMAKANPTANIPVWPDCRKNISPNNCATLNHGRV